MSTIDDKSRVRLSIPQFWGIIVAVAAATAAVVGSLNSIRSEQMALRGELGSYRERVDTQITATNQTLTEVKNDRAESKREWLAWRSQVDQTTTRHGTEIIQLQNDRRAPPRPN